MIYLDNAATTKLAAGVLEAMLPFYTESFGNASTVYGLGNQSRRAIAHAREQVAALMGALPEEVYFTSGGSESDNWALRCAVLLQGKLGGHIITTAIEHHAVLHTCEALEKEGIRITYLPVDEQGCVRPQDLEAAIGPDTVLVSVMMANNEIGTIEPIKELAQIAHTHGALFHTDAVQTLGQIPVDVNELQVDMLSASAHKLGGPKGIGCLYIRKGIKLPPFICGGHQERGRRAGTENVPGIVGFGQAASHAMEALDEKMVREREIRDHMLERIYKEIPLVTVNGSMEHRLPGNLNLNIPFVEGETLLILLDRKGICASSGSACTTGAVDPSHVLMAIGQDREKARGSLRLTLSEDTTLEEVDTAVDALVEIVTMLRGMSPQYQEYLKKMG